MPIKGLTDRGLAFPEIGQIRKGKKVTGKRKDGSEYERPVDLKYFRVVFDEKEVESATLFREKYGDEPDQINIILPFNEIERCWDAWLEAYTAGRMVARSDGEIFTYLIDTDTGEILVKNGKPEAPYTEGQKVGENSNGKDIFCSPVGRLKVIIPELARAAYMTVHTTSQIDIANLSNQLNAFKELNNGVIKGIPLVIRRSPRKIGIPKKDGTKVRVEKWMLSIEADPAWVKAKLAEAKHLSLPDVYPLLPGEEDEVIESKFVDEEPEELEPQSHSADDVDEEVIESASRNSSEEKEEKEEISETSDPDEGVDVYEFLVAEGLSPDVKDAKSVLGKCRTGYDTFEKAIEWMKLYNMALDSGGTTAQAVKIANKGGKVK